MFKSGLTLPAEQSRLVLPIKHTGELALGWLLVVCVTGYYRGFG